MRLLGMGSTVSTDFCRPLDIMFLEKDTITFDTYSESTHHGTFEQLLARVRLESACDVRERGFHDDNQQRLTQTVGVRRLRRVELGGKWDEVIGRFVPRIRQRLRDHAEGVRQARGQNGAVAVARRLLRGFSAAYDSTRLCSCRRLCSRLAWGLRQSTSLGDGKPG